jgi:hypothetical protein
MPSIIVGNQSPYLSGLSSGSRDAVTGEVTVSYTYIVPQESDVLTVGQSSLGNLREVSRSWNQIEGCLGYEVTIKYEGKPETDVQQFELDVSFSEEPLPSHPNWKKIKKDYKGTVTDEEVSFDEFITPPKGYTGVTTDDGKIKNPMYGMKTWLALKAVVRHTFESTQRPSLSMIGRITKRAPGGYETPDNHDWLVMPPKCRKKYGGVNPEQELFEITVEYLLSPLGGWPKGVYEIMEGKFSPEEQSEREFNAPRLGDKPFMPATGWNL